MNRRNIIIEWRRPDPESRSPGSPPAREIRRLHATDREDLRVGRQDRTQRGEPSRPHLRCRKDLEPVRTRLEGDEALGRRQHARIWL